MNINPIISSPVIKNIYMNKRMASFKSKEAQDSFERTSHSPNTPDNKAIQWIEQTDYVRKNLIKTITNPKNKIGSGFMHTTYVIPENAEYIFRTQNFIMPDEEITSYEITDTEDKNLTVNIGQQVAEIKLKDEAFPMWTNIEILRRQKGEPLGVKPYTTIYTEDGKLREGELPYGDISRKEAFEKSIHLAAQMPEEAYEKLIENLDIAGKNGYSFDYYNSNNILIDADSQSFNLIDMDKGRQPADYGSVLYALTNISYFDTYMSKYDGTVMPDDHINSTIGDMITIIEKYTSAMKKKNLKFSRENCSVQFQDFILSPPCSFFCQTFDYDLKWERLEKMGLA